MASIIAPAIPGPGNALILSTDQGGIRHRRVSPSAIPLWRAVAIAPLTFLYGPLLFSRFPAQRMRASPCIARGLEKIAGLSPVGFGVKLTLG